MNLQLRLAMAAFGVAAVCTIVIAPLAASDEVSEKGPAILEKNKDAVVPTASFSKSRTFHNI